MSCIKKVIISFIISFSCFLPEVFSQNLPEVIALRELELNKATNEIVFLNYYSRWCKLIREHSKGVNGWVMKGDRGNRSGQYILSWSFNYKSTRDYYFPISDMANYPQWNAVLSKFDFRAPRHSLVDSIRSYTDFVVLGFFDLIIPQMGEIIAIRYFEVDEDKQEEFEKFIIQDYHNAYQAHIDGFYNYILKGDRGDREGTYCLMTIFDTADRRNEYFPVPLAPASESYSSQQESLSDIDVKFRSFLNEDITSDYTDYIVVF